MSKIKIIDLNKQLKTMSKETVEKMEALQTSVQSHLATLKKIEAEMLQIERAAAEERKHQEEQEARLAAEKARQESEQAEKEKAAATQKAVVEEKKSTEDKKEEPKKAAKEEKPEVKEEKPKPVAKEEKSEKKENKPRAAKEIASKSHEHKPEQKKTDKPEPAQKSDDSKYKRKPAHTTDNKQSGTSGYVHVDSGKKSSGRKHNSYNDDYSRKSRKIKEKGVFEGDDRYRGRKRNKKSTAQNPIAPIIIDKAVMTTEMISVKSLAEKTGKPVAAILKKLLLLGMMCNINSELDFDTAQLICAEFDITLELKLDKTAEDVLDEGHQDEPDERTETRPPIVTIMGHAAAALVKGEMTGAAGDTFDAGKLGTKEVIEDPTGGTQIMLGDPFKFDPDNIAEWKDVY